MHSRYPKQKQSLSPRPPSPGVNAINTYPSQRDKKKSHYNLPKQNQNHITKMIKQKENQDDMIIKNVHIEVHQEIQINQTKVKNQIDQIHIQDHIHIHHRNQTNQIVETHEKILHDIQDVIVVEVKNTKQKIVM